MNAAINNAGFRGAHAPSRAGDRASRSQTFSPTEGKTSLPWIKDCFGEGAETSTRGACAPRKTAAPSFPLFI
jgi:hypothetical protein